MIKSNCTCIINLKLCSVYSLFYTYIYKCSLGNRRYYRKHREWRSIEIHFSQDHDFIIRFVWSVLKGHDSLNDTINTSNSLKRMNIFVLQMPVKLCNLGVGATFGDSILHDLPRDSTVVTKTTCELLRVEQQDFHLIWEVSREFCLFIRIFYRSLS